MSQPSLYNLATAHASIPLRPSPSWEDSFCSLVHISSPPGSLSRTDCINEVPVPPDFWSAQGGGSPHRRSEVSRSVESFMNPLAHSLRGLISLHPSTCPVKVALSFQVLETGPSHSDPTKHLDGDKLAITGAGAPHHPLCAPKTQPTPSYVVPLLNIPGAFSYWSAITFLLGSY